MWEREREDVFGEGRDEQQMLWYPRKQPRERIGDAEGISRRTGLMQCGEWQDQFPWIGAMISCVWVCWLYAAAMYAVMLVNISNITDR